MKLTDKAAKVNFDNLDDEQAPTAGGVVATDQAMATAATQGAVRPRTTGVAGITERINLHHQVQELQAQVSSFEKAQIVVKLDPRRIRDSKWKNRHELSFSTQDYVDLKAEIEAAGGNVQPIKVRRIGKTADGGDEYEIVYGRRRKRACMDLGFEVAAIVEEMDDIALFKEMERENRSRADLSPWEQGVMYKEALDAKLFVSQRQLAGELNVSLGALNVALSLASLPEEVISAFPSPLDLQYRWAAELNEALEKDTAKVLTTARELMALAQKPSAREVLGKLVAAAGAPSVEPVVKELMNGTRVVGSVTKDARGGLMLKLKAGALSPGNEKKLIEFVERLVG